MVYGTMCYLQVQLGFVAGRQLFDKNLAFFPRMILAKNQERLKKKKKNKEKEKGAARRTKKQCSKRREREKEKSRQPIVLDLSPK